MIDPEKHLNSSNDWEYIEALAEYMYYSAILNGITDEIKAKSSASYEPWQNNRSKHNSYVRRYMDVLPYVHTAEIELQKAAERIMTPQEYEKMCRGNLDAFT